MNTQRLSISFADRTVSFQEEVTRPVHVPSISAMVVDTPEPRVWLRPTPTEETFVTRERPKKRASLFWLCLVSIVLGALGGYLGRGAVPLLQRMAVRAPRQAEPGGSASLVTRSASAKIDQDVPKPAPPPMKRRPLRVAPPDHDLEMETSFRMDS